MSSEDFRSSLDARQLRQIETFERRYGQFGTRGERRETKLTIEKTGNAGDVPGYYVRGHAAVYERKSLDLGGFREIIAPAAFTDVLDTPNLLVHLNWDHDMGRALASTQSKTYLLELREDPKGLHYYAKVAPTEYAKDLRILMEGGVIDQASFAFTVADDTWEIRNEGKPDEVVLRTINRIGELFDVTITAQGAYPQTDSQIVRAYAKHYAHSRTTKNEPVVVTRPALRDRLTTTTTDGREPVAMRTTVAEWLREWLPKQDPSSAAEARTPDPEAVPAAPTAPQAETPEEPNVGISQPPQPPETGGEGDTAPLTNEGDANPPEDPLLRAARFNAAQALRKHRFLLEGTK